MSDIIDQANEAAELILRSQLSVVAKRQKPTGFCGYCGELTTTDEDARAIASGCDIDAPAYCSADCRNDHEYELTIKRKQGLL